MDLLESLNSNTLPEKAMQEFMAWCIWQQALQAVLLILEGNNLSDLAVSLQKTQDLNHAYQVTATAHDIIQSLKNDSPLGRSAAEGVMFEFMNLLNAAQEEVVDADAIAFFAARVCGWAGWAVTEFSDMTEKAAAEKAARLAQAAQLQLILDQTPKP